MSDRITATADTTALLAAFAQLPESVARAYRSVAFVTAHNISREAGRRLNAQTTVRSGETQAGIGVEETKDGRGYLVFVSTPKMPNKPLWLEYGTSRMTPRPFFRDSARLEEGPHQRRTLLALQEAVRVAGLGD